MNFNDHKITRTLPLIMFSPNIHTHALVKRAKKKLNTFNKTQNFLCSTVEGKIFSC